MSTLSTSKITVYCSTYNSIKWIKGYLNNINSQISEPFDLFFIDAGSTDGSLEEIKQFKFNPHINVSIFEPGFLSIYEAWSLAVVKSNTPYLMNFNTDDRLNFHALSTYHNYIEEYPEVDLFYGVHNFVSEIGGPNLPIGEYWRNLTDSLLSESEEKLMFSINPCGPFPLVKKQSLVNAGEFDKKYFSSADYDMWLRMFSMGMKFKRTQDIIGDFLYRPDSVSQSKLKESETHDKEIQLKYKKSKK